MAFPKLQGKIAKADCLVFFDIEATQYSHKMISFGARITPKKPGELIPDQEGLSYSRYLHCDDKVGSYVEKLTGITDEKLKKEGLTLYEFIVEFTALLRPFKRKVFVSYSRSDLKFLKTTLNFSDVTERDFYRFIYNSYFDLYDYFSKRIISKDGNSLSVEKLCDLFQIKEDHFHRAINDADALYQIYKTYVSDEDRAVSLLYDNFESFQKLDEINKMIAMKVYKTGSASKEDLIRAIKEYL